MQLVVDRFKPSGKWYDDYSVPLTVEEALSVNPSWDHDAWLDFFEKKAGHTVRSNEFSLFIRIENQAPESDSFCRYLVHPNQPKREYVPLKSF
jgi:hypothetical protein